MDGTTARATPWGGVELLERAIGYTRGSLVDVTPDLLRAPTPCAEWDLVTLLTHMDDSLASLHEARSLGRVEVRSSPRPLMELTALVAGLRERACQLLAEWTADWSGDHAAGDVSVAGRGLTPRVLTSAGALEITVHGWDVAVACGAHRPIPAALAADLLRVAPLLVTEADRPARFAAPVASAPEAPAGDRLLCLLGRLPRPDLGNDAGSG